jgi:hypothetical protein
MAFDKDTYCSFCYMPGAKHEGGAEINGKHVSGVFCKKECFDKWLRWKRALISASTYQIDMDAGTPLTEGDAE